MASLPNGTVTFLFTDIQGSTRLWEQHPEAMKHALLRAAIETQEGYVFKLIGDAVCAAFHAAPQALAATLAAQRALQAGPLPAVALPFWRAAVRLVKPQPVWQDFPHGGWAGPLFYGSTTDYALDPASALVEQLEQQS